MTAFWDDRRKVINDLKGRKSLSFLEAKRTVRGLRAEVVTTDEWFRGA